MSNPNFQLPFCPLEGDDYGRCRQAGCAWWAEDIGACVVHKIAAYGPQAAKADPDTGATERPPPLG